MHSATYLTENGMALCDEHRNSAPWADHTVAVCGHPRYDIGRVVLGEDAEVTCSVCVATMADIPAGTSAVLRVWSGAGFTLVRGTIEAVEPSADFPEDPDTRIVILAEDVDNTYRAGDVVVLGPSGGNP